MTTRPAQPPAPAGATLRRLRGARRPLALIALALVLAALVLASVAVGPRPIPLAEVWRALVAPDGGRNAIVVWDLRMPRTALGLITGAALGLAGALMQAMTRNPLADPGLLGVNAGASFCVVMAIAVLGVTRYEAYVWFAIAGAAIAATAVYLLSAHGDSAVRQVRLVLAGAAVSACLGAVTGVVTMADSAVFDSYRFWVVGSLDGRSAAVAGQVLPFALAGAAAALALAGQFNAVALGDDAARMLGVRLATVRVAGFAAVVMLSGAATAAAGPIGFVGLVVPHVLRLLVGPDWRWIMPFSLLGGPALVLLADVIGRVIARPGEVEAGIVTAFIGAPALLWLVTAMRRAG